MAIAPISNVKLSQYNNSVSFGSKRKHLELPEENNNNKSSGKKASKLATVPVIVMMAMAPGMMDGKTPANVIPMDSEQLTELIAQNTSYVTEAPQASRPVKNQRCKNMLADQKDHIYESFEIINANNSAKITKPRSYTMTFECAAKVSQGLNMVHFIHLYPYDIKAIDKSNFVSEEVEYEYDGKALVYHKTGANEGFWGLIIRDTVENFPALEIEIPDNIAQKILDLINGNRPQKDCTNTNVYEISNDYLLSPNRIKEMVNANQIDL